MKNIEQFLNESVDISQRGMLQLKKAFSTLMTSWGGDPPPEAFWAANDFIDFLNSELGMGLDYFVEGDINNDILN